MGSGSESKQVLDALNERLRSKPEGAREFLFRNGNEACEGLGLKGKMRTRTVRAMLDHLHKQSIVRMITLDGVTRVTNPRLD